MKARNVLTSGEVARLCNVNFRTVLRWIERGELPAYQLPGRGDNRIRRDDFLDFISAHRIPMPDGFQSQKQRVLVVDDEPHMARSISRVMVNEGYEVKTAGNGFRAGTYLGTFLPQVVTLDLQIPGLSGFDVLSFIRETPGLERIGIIVVSGMDDGSLNQALQQGANAVLSKPFQNEELVEKVRELMERSHDTASTCA